MEPIEPVFPGVMVSAWSTPEANSMPEEMPSSPAPWPPRPDVAPAEYVPKEPTTVPAIHNHNDPISPDDHNPNTEYCYQSYIVLNFT